MIEHLLQAERALANGLLDQAEALYRSAVEADARNAIAVVGLARVAVERGDEARALELGSRALELDPENSAAQRLVARIREVRAYRGETVEGWAPEESLAVVHPPVETTAELAGGPTSEQAPAPATASQPTPDPSPRSPAQPRSVRRRSLLDRLLGRSRPAR